MPGPFPDPEPIKMLVTPREDSPPPVIVATPGNAANIQIVEWPWYKQAAVRAARATIFGTLGSGASLNLYSIYKTAQATEQGTIFTAIDPIVGALLGAVGTFIVSFLWNTYELTAQWDTSHPKVRG